MPDVPFSPSSPPASALGSAVYADDPSSQARNVRRLRGPEGFLRLRVGDWRVVMRDAATLEVLHIVTRGHAYRD